MPKKRKKTKKPIIQKHHICYKDKDGFDWTVDVFKGEHKILSLIQWYCRKKISLGFLIALKEVYFKRLDEAIDLEEEKRNGELESSGSKDTKKAK